MTEWLQQLANPSVMPHGTGRVMGSAMDWCISSAVAHFRSMVKPSVRPA